MVTLTRIPVWVERWLCVALCAAFFSMDEPAHGQSLDSALAFYPLSVGDQWQFEHFCRKASVGYYDVVVERDTLMANGRTYKVVVYRDIQIRCQYLGTRWQGYFRVDSSSACVFKYWPDQPLVEIQAESLLAMRGDRFTRFPSQNTVSGGPYWTMILGNVTMGKTFSDEMDSHYSLAYGFGPVLNYFVVDWDYESRLVYAKIGGQTYGTRVSINDKYFATPTEIQLEQNYPNPFNPSTTIRYGIPVRSHVSLAVYNTLGQRVAQLVDGEVEAGYNEVKFDAASLPSGVYLDRLQVGRYVEAKKLLIVR